MHAISQRDKEKVYFGQGLHLVCVWGVFSVVLSSALA